MAYAGRTGRTCLAVMIAAVWAVFGAGAGSAPAAQIIVDNTDAGFTVLYGTWDTYSASGQWGSDYRYKTTSTTVTGEVEWRPTITEADDYTISVWYRSTQTTRPNNAHYRVYYDGGTADHYVNQLDNGSQWVTLGTYPLAAGTVGRVTLTDEAQNNKTIVADAVKFESPGPAAPEFRSFWADVFHAGFRSTGEIDAMISRAVQGNYNAILPEVLAFHDTSTPSHGAYWESDVVARSSVVSGGFDPLAYMVQQAHAAGLEVHPWLVAFRVSSSWPPPGNAYLAARPEWLMVPSADLGSIAPVGSYYTFDPGSPGVQEYLVSIVRELVTNYEIDGIHWDYIRYTQTDAGYPTGTGYAGSSLARFKAITGYASTPSPGYGPWSDFRRRSITELIRRVRAEIPLITSNPRQPLRHTAALVTWWPASTNFHATNPYALFCDWEYWASQAYLDATIPMAYFDEDGSYADTYRDWVDNSVAWAYQRHTFIGPGIYMNSFANSVTQMEYARAAGADGLCTYSYAATSDTGSLWSDWYPYAAGTVFTQPAPTPPMPWRDPATAVEGTLFGRVTDAVSGLPVDDATVQVSGLAPVQTDGNGYYVVTLIPATSGGTAYGVTASHGSYPTPTESSVTVRAGTVARHDLLLGEGPDITQQPAAQEPCLGAAASFTVQASGTGTLQYQWRKDGADLSNGGKITGAQSATLAIDNVDATDVGDYACLVTDDAGGTLSDAAALTLGPETVITQQPQPQEVLPGETAVFSVTAGGKGTIGYQWQKDGQDLVDGAGVSGATSAVLQIGDVGADDLGFYRCVVTADCGSDVSSAADLTLQPVAVDFDGDGDVDLVDFAHMQVCLSGTANQQNDPDCQDTRLDGDSDVDQDDVGLFLLCMSGPDVPAAPGCTE